jgi:CopG family nickel-responsive transcriptional regulator
MPSLIRFGVSIDRDLLARFDALIAAAEYGNRSEAFRDLIRARLTAEEVGDPERHAFGVLTLVYNHHRRDLERRLTSVQHEHHHRIVSTTHVHIDHENCLEVILLRGRVREIRLLANALAGVRGVSYSNLNLTAAVPPDSPSAHHKDSDHDHSHPHQRSGSRGSRAARAPRRRQRTGT